MKRFIKISALVMALELVSATNPIGSSVCLAHEEQKVPEAPLILLMNEARKQNRKTVWTKEIRSERDLELTLRNYIEGIVQDCHANQHLISPSNDQWLEKLLAWHRFYKDGKKRFGTLASENTLVPRTALQRFAGKKAMDLIDQSIQKSVPPYMRDERWFPPQGDFPENEEIRDHEDPDLTPGKNPRVPALPKNVS